jgi:hypothetical protein
MPSKGGGGGSVQAPTLYTPSGLYQGLSQLESLGTYGQSLFNPLASMTNWASSLATGGAAEGIGTYGANSLVTGPQINIGGGHQPADQWTTQFNPSTGQVTLTNTMTGEQMMEGVTSPQLQQWFANQGGGPQTLQQWQALMGKGGQTVGGGTSGLNPFTGGQSGYGGLGPQLGTAWQQIQDIGNLEAQTQNWTNQAQTEASELLHESMTGEGVTKSQAAWINQGVQAQQQQLSQQLASEGLGSSTANAILKGEASQQGAATAGQLVQGNIALAQSAQKLALGGQELTLGEQSAMAQMSMNLQGQLWTQAMQGYGMLGQMMSTIGNIYGTDIQGYYGILQQHVANDQQQLQASQDNAQLQAGAASSMGQGLGSIMSLLGGSGSSGGGGGIFGSGGIGSLFSGIGSLFGGGSAAVGAIGSGVAAGGAASAAGVASDAAIAGIAAL